MSTKPARSSPRAVRRDGLLEPASSSPARTARPASRFKAPTALSEYRITARGVTGADTLVGQTTASLTVRKNFFVDLKVPGSLTQGDKPRFIAQVHHAGVAGKLALRLAIYAGRTRGGLPQDDRAQGGRRRRGPVRAVRGPRGRLGPPDAHGHDRRRERRADGRGADPSLGRRRRSPRRRAPAARARRSSSGCPPGRTYENPEMLIVLSPTLERMLIELAARRRRLSRSAQLELRTQPGGSAIRRRTRRPTAPPTCWRRRRRLQYLRTARAAARARGRSG